MKKALLFLLSLAVLVSISACATSSSDSGAENNETDPYWIAAQAFRKISMNEENSDVDPQTVVGYYHDTPITKDHVAYRQAMNKVNQSAEESEEEIVFSIAKDLYVLEQAKELGFYPSEKEIENFFAEEDKSFEKNLEENLDFCAETGLTREEAIAWSIQTKTESMAKGRFLSHVLQSLTEAETIDDEILAELVQTLSENYQIETVQKIYDRYLTLQVQEEVLFRE